MSKEYVIVEDEKGFQTKLSSEEFPRHFGMTKLMVCWDTTKPCPYKVKKIGKDFHTLISEKHYKIGDKVILYLGVIGNNNINDYTIDFGENKSIDPSKKGNLARFINHASDAQPISGAATANLMQFSISGEAVLFATKEIKSGDALLFNYGPEWFNFRKDRFPDGPLLFNREGQPLKERIPQSDIGKQVFALRELLAIEQATIRLISSSRIKVPFNPCRALQSIFPQYTWYIVTGDSSLIVTKCNTMTEVHRAYSFLKNNLDPSTIIQAQTTPGKLLIIIENFDQDQYIKTLKLRIDFELEFQIALAKLEIRSAEEGPVKSLGINPCLFFPSNEKPEAALQAANESPRVLRLRGG